MGFRLLFALSFDPRFELPDGFALYRHLDVGVEGIDFLARGVAHEGFPHVLHDTRFHEARVERVAKIVKAAVANASPPDRRSPGGLDALDRTALVGKDQAFRVRAMQVCEEVGETRCERNLAGLPAGGFRVSDGEHATGKVDVLGALREEFSPAHPGVEGRDRDLAEMRRSRIEEFRFFGEAQDRPWFAPRLREPHAGDGVCVKEAFVHRPIKEMAKDLDVAVQGGLGKLLLFMPCGAELPDRRLGDCADRPLAEMRQEHLEAVEMVRARRTVGEEPRRKARERHIRRGLADLVALPVELFPKLALDRLGLAPVGRSRCFDVSDAIDPELDRELPAPLI